MNYLKNFQMFFITYKCIIWFITLQELTYKSQVTAKQAFNYDVSPRKTDIPYINYHGQPSTSKEMKKKSDIDTYNLALTNEINSRYKKNVVEKTPIFLDRSSLSIPNKPDKSKLNEIQKNDSIKTNEVKKPKNNSPQSLSSKTFSNNSSNNNGVKPVDSSKYVSLNNKPNSGNYPINVNFNKEKETKSKPDTNNNVDIKPSNSFKQTSNPKKYSNDVNDVENFNRSNGKKLNMSNNLPLKSDLKKQIGKTSNSKFSPTVSEESTEKLLEDVNDIKIDDPKKVLNDTNGKELENDDSKKNLNYLAYKERKKKNKLNNKIDRAFQNSYNKKEIHQKKIKRPLNRKSEYEPKKNSYFENSRDDSNEDSTTREESNDIIDKHFNHDSSKKRKKPSNKVKEILIGDAIKIKKNNVLDTKNNIPLIQNLGKREKPLSSNQMVGKKNRNSRRQINQDHLEKSGRKDGKTKKTILRLILKTNDESSDESDQKSTEIKSKRKLRKQSPKNTSKTGSKTKYYNGIKPKSDSRKYVNDEEKDFIPDSDESAEKISSNKTIEDSGQRYKSGKRRKNRSPISKKRSVKDQNKTLCSSSKKCIMEKTKEISLGTQEDKPKKLTVVKYKVYGR